MEAGILMNKSFPLASRCFAQIHLWDSYEQILSSGVPLLCTSHFYKCAHKLLLIPPAQGMMACICPGAPALFMEVGASVAGCGSQWAMALQRLTTSALPARAAIDPGFYRSAGVEFCGWTFPCTCIFNCRSLIQPQSS